MTRRPDYDIWPLLIAIITILLVFVLCFGAFRDAIHATQAALPEQEPETDAFVEIEPEGELDAPVVIAWEPEPEWPPEHEVQMLAIAIYREAGGNAACDECRKRVGDVVLNRVADPRFPDTLEGVLTQRGQYGRMYWTGVTWPDRASLLQERAAVDRAVETARALLMGDHSDLYGQGYIYQSEFPHLGHDRVTCCGINYAKG